MVGPTRVPMSGRAHQGLAGDPQMPMSGRAHRVMPVILICRNSALGNTLFYVLLTCILTHVLRFGHNSPRCALPRVAGILKGDRRSLPNIYCKNVRTRSRGHGAERNSVMGVLHGADLIVPSA